MKRNDGEAATITLNSKEIAFKNFCCEIKFLSMNQSRPSDNSYFNIILINIDLSL